MFNQSIHLDRRLRYILLNRFVGFVIACAFLSFLLVSAGSEGHLRKTFGTLSKQATKSAVSAAPALTGDGRPDFDAQLHDVTTPLIDAASLAPFPTLPPPDNEEYMAICMAGQYFEACY